MATGCRCRRSGDMATWDEWYALVVERHTAHGHALAVVRKALRDGLPVKRPIQEASRVAGQLADAWRELAKVPS